MVEPYEVFLQRKREDRAVHVGSVEAYSSENALETAKEIYARRDICFRIVVVPRSCMRATSSEEAVLFQLSFAKQYRRPAFFSKRMQGMSDEPPILVDEWRSIDETT
ncbi:MAG: 1,2-phenylacetyl-CoA epoxidase subunit B [Firmicutes bacterium]|nr:1,2-phenylacetyl-CoA epoxidase subunit B [Bacillota bacterium]